MTDSYIANTLARQALERVQERDGVDMSGGRRRKSRSRSRGRGMSGGRRKRSSSRKGRGLVGGYSGRIGAPKGATTTQFNKAVDILLKLGNGSFDRDAVEWALLEPVNTFTQDTPKDVMVEAVLASVTKKLGSPIELGLRKSHQEGAKFKIGKGDAKSYAESILYRIISAVPAYFWKSTKAKKMRQDLSYSDDYLSERLEKEDALAEVMDKLSYSELAKEAAKEGIKLGDRMAIMEYLRGQGIIGGRRGRSRSRSRSRSHSRGRGLETMFGSAGLEGGRRRKSRSRSRGRGMAGGSRWTQLVKKHRGNMSAAKKEYYGRKRSSSKKGSGMAGGRRKRSSSRSRRFGKLY